MASFKKISAWVLLSFVVVTFQNCAPFESSTLESSGVNQLNFFKALDENVIAPKCLTCHSGATPAGGKNFSSYDTLLASNVVLIGNPTASTLYTAVANPVDLTHAILNDIEISALEQWILAGAEENVSPVVNAGRDLNVSLPLSTVRLAGQASDRDGQVTSVLWTIQMQPTGALSTISNSTTLNASLTNLVAGTYQINLSVTDDFGDTSNDLLSVVVSPAGNVAPVVNAGVDRTITLPTNMLAITSVSSDSDGNVVSYLWTQVSGPNNALLSGAMTPELMASNLIQGAYVFRILVTDNSGATANDTVRVTVNPVAPVAPTYTELSSEIFVPLCLGCHSGNRPSGGYNMFTYTATMTRVRAGNASGSEFYQRVIDNTMPPASPLSTQQKNRIRDWINAGALNN